MKAFYFVTDEACADVASAQAVWLTKLWSNVDIHLFIERRNRESSIREMRSPQIYYHYDKLSPFLPEGLPGSKAWPNVVYLRLFAPRLLKEYSRLCYLDSDVLCLQADPAFWDVPLQSGLGMVSDYDVHQNPPPDMSHMTRDAWLDAIGVSSGRYGNSGVLLIDPAVFSNYCVENALPEYFEKHPQANRYDQDFLNSYLDGQWTEFGPRLNYQAGLQSLGYERIIDPVFIHFCRHMKPWQKADPRWIAPSDPRFFEIYAQVFYESGFDIANFAKSFPISKIAVTRYWVRSKLTRIGVQSGRERRLRAEWVAKAEFFHSYVNAALAEARFGDENGRTSIPKSDLRPSFDGRYLYMPTDGERTCP